MKLIIVGRIKQKLLEKHNVTEKEIEEAFLNRERGFLIDKREEHLTDPATRWFIAETNHKRLLKVCFIPSPDGGIIRTAYEPNSVEIGIYAQYSK